MPALDCAYKLQEYAGIDCDFDVVIRRTAYDVLRHDVLGGHFGQVDAVCERAAGNVTIGDHSHESTVCLDGNRADVTFTHALRDLTHEGVRFDAGCAFVHDVFDLHFVLLKSTSRNQNYRAGSSILFDLRQERSTWTERAFQNDS
jgi:hypothetical protein